MRLIALLLSACLAARFCPAQSSARTPEQTFHEQTQQADALYQKHAYAEAAAILERLSNDPQITALPAWPSVLDELASCQALAGEPKKALLTLQQLADQVIILNVDQLRNDPDLASLHADPDFQAFIAKMARQAAVWKDDPAIASPYKPELTEDEKIAGLSKIWSEAHFNFPFFGRLPDTDWDRLYLDYLPQVRSAQTTADYYRVLRRFVAALRDGHTEIWPPKELNDSFFASPPMSTQRIEDKVLITEVYDPALEAEGVTVGTEIVSINDKPVQEYAESDVAPYASGSTVQDRDNRTYGYMLLQGAKGEPIRLTLRGADGVTKSIIVNRYCGPASKCSGPNQQPVQFKMLPGNVAYLAVHEFVDDKGAKAMQDNFPAIAQAGGLILDVRENRGGNQQNAVAILKMLTNRPFAQVRVRTLDYKPRSRTYGIVGWLNEAGAEENPDLAHYYSKRVIVLTGPGTFSAAENLVVLFDAMHRGTLVGATTPGSTGDSVMFKLPGGGTARIMMADVEYPDGRIFEGVGVKPQVTVAPTMLDIREGRDPVLQRAVEIISNDHQTQ
jgi:C-terminal processing protease CtpA/Prc